MKYLFALVLLAGALGARAQGVLTFERDLHDFGAVPEGTMAAHEFRFKNTGNQPVVIANVQASCGCTTPDWTKTPVLPGKSGIVRAVYSSAGRPGVFSKTVTVTSNAAEPSHVLTIKGTVLTKDKQKKTLTPAEIARSPRLVIEGAPAHDFGRLESGQQLSARFVVHNAGKSPLVLGALGSACYCVGYKVPPAPIAPGQSATVELVYAPRQLGPLADVVTLQSNDVASAGDAKLTLRATVVRTLAPESLVKESGTAVPFK
ncbi:DUF1573 domain-containing protein [Hymenobacter coccineus]|uniref:DUF1573 domain-containing protein n=1 Tax=Hymenobacter coccineus TaxID=1908235 RepID=A0A1G1TD60_9BACT|nr:DUF1573 domain-containing protein [Hymenobacter coccineus]OGX88813.1 hypothetical protein BEN49_09985 [Hymenobacter coccineus]